MLLTVDIGNTNSVFGLFAGTELKVHGRFPSRRDWTSDELELMLMQWLTHKLGGPQVVSGVAVCSVVPPIEHIVRTAIGALLPGVPQLVVSPGIRTGIAVRYENPKEVGADRIVNAVAAYAQVQDALIVVDFGTAITFDVVGKDGAYLGGAISPGIHISTEALFRSTSKLPRIDPAPPDEVVGRTTVDSLQSGVFYGFLGLVEGMVDRLHAELGKVTVLATGGWAETFGPHTSRIDVVDPWLTLKGLRILYERNQLGT